MLFFLNCLVLSLISHFSQPGNVGGTPIDQLVQSPLVQKLVLEANPESLTILLAGYLIQGTLEATNPDLSSVEKRSPGLLSSFTALLSANVLAAHLSLLAKNERSERSKSLIDSGTFRKLQIKSKIAPSLIETVTAWAEGNSTYPEDALLAEREQLKEKSLELYHKFRLQQRD